jgi:hypothetical protein
MSYRLVDILQAGTGWEEKGHYQVSFSAIQIRNTKIQSAGEAQLPLLVYQLMQLFIVFDVCEIG